MAAGFPSGREAVGYGYGGGSAVRVPFPAQSEASGGGGGALKRTMTEIERLQHAFFLRSVKQRTQLASSISPVGFASASSPLISSSALMTPSSSLMASALLTPSSFGLSRGQELSNSAAGVPPGKASCPATNSAMKNRLEELERRLLLDDDDDNDESTLTNSDWNGAMENLISAPASEPPRPPLPAMATPATIPLSPSPTNSASSSSTVSSAASCSPNSSLAAPSSRQMLLDAAAAISDGNVETAMESLAVLKRAANSRGDAEQRLTSMLVTALLSRLNTQASSSQVPISASVPAPVHPVAEFCSDEHFVATQMLYDMSPCFKLGLFAANYAILEATNDKSKIHILDFEVGHGGHYAVLLRGLADRYRSATAARSPPDVKITAFADPTSPFTNTNNNSSSTTGSLRAVGHRIEKIAERAGLKLRFNVVSRRVTELDATTLGCEPGETLAVNLPFVLSRVADESVSPANPRDELLRRVRALRPRMVVLVEQEINTNTAPFASRFAEACGHYGALLESLEATAARDSGERARVEAALFRKAVNSVAREGADRVERCEVFGKWRARMGMAGFQQVSLAPTVTEQVKARLASPARPNPGFTVKEDMAGPGLGLGFGWMGRVVTVASTWR